MAIKLSTGDISGLYLGSTAVSAAYLGSTSVWSAGGGAFDPTTIAGLEMWYDASDSSTLYDATSGGSLVAADGVVARWEDKSGNSRHATSASAGPTRKSSVHNGLDVLQFGSGKQFTIPSQAIPNSHTLFAVWDRATSNNNAVTLAASDLSRYSHWWQPSGYINTKTNTSYVDWTRTYDSGILAITEIRNATTSTSLRKNGTALQTIASGGGITSASSGSYDSISAGYHDGNICEILFYSAALSDADRDSVEAYLIAKWGIA